MNRVRSVFNSVMNKDRYSRFTLQTEQDGERRVEVKLSEDGTDGDAEGGAGGSPTFRPVQREHNQKNLCYLILSIVLIFIIGYMLAFLIHGKRRVEPNCEPKISSGPTPDEGSTLLPHEPEPPLPWADITNLLETKLTSLVFSKSLSEFDQPSRSAGSAGDTYLGNRIFDTFQKLEMNPWTDVHHVRLQTPDSTKPNQVTFGSDVFKPEGFLAYSGTGKAQGKLVYANFGRPQDFAVLTKYNVAAEGSVVILRSGNISFAQKVANAEERGAVAVLIYSDFKDDSFLAKAEVYGHVHLGTGDPYTPGFPSFNHTQFPPTKSAGLPNIPAQTITGNMAKTILQTIGGPVPDANSGFSGQPSPYSLGGVKNITVEVNNVLAFKEIHNVFGVIKGFIDPDRYVVLGAQRDAWGNGYARANVGTCALVELAKAVQEMVVKDNFKPRRSIVFASWSAGEYGSVGATEWLEAYTSSLDKSVLAYISLDGIVQGYGSFYASASPLLQNIVDGAMNTVRSPTGKGNVRDLADRTNPMHPMSVDDPAYPFLASSGIPSVSFHFTSTNSDEYLYYNTPLDSKDHLDYATAQKTPFSVALAAQFAGQMALRLVHDHLLNFDVTGYKKLLNINVYRVNTHIGALTRSGNLKDVSTSWLFRAKSSFQRAADGLFDDMQNTDLNDPEACRLLNDRIMKIEHSLLSPYASPIDTPYRHLLFGKGHHTLAALAEMNDLDQLHTQLALATWNLQGCANSMVGNLWDIDNEI